MTTKQDEKLEQAVALLEQAQADFDAGNFDAAAGNLDKAHSLGDEVLTELDVNDDLSTILDQMEGLGTTDDWQTLDADELKATSSEIAEIRTNLEAFELPESNEGN